MEFLQLPYEERQLILIVKNEQEKIDKLKAIQDNKELVETLLSSVAIAQAVSFFLPGSLVVKSAMAAASVIGNKTIKSKSSGGHFYIATMQEVEAVTFPSIRPVIGRVYAANPAATEIYYETTNFHKSIADHKFAEAIKLLQALGATRIEAINLEDQGNSSNVSGSVSDFGNAGVKHHKNKIMKTSFNATYKPTHQPYIPSNLAWIRGEGQWQNIADGRIHGGMESFELEVEVNTDFGINVDLLAKIDKALKINLQASYNSFKNTHLRLYGEFSSI
jgi:hypothetical protein